MGLVLTMPNAPVPKYTECGRHTSGASDTIAIMTMEVAGHQY